MIRRLARFGMAAFAVLAFGASRPAAAQTSGDTWNFTAGLYVWLPTINADLKFGLPPGQPGSPVVEIGPNDYLTHLNFVLPVFGEARKGDFSIFTDVLYLNLTAEGSHLRDITVGPDRFPIPASLDIGTETKVKAFEWTLVGGYTLAKGPAGNLDVVGGLRYLGSKFTTDWNLSADFTLRGGTKVFSKTGSISQSEDLWDGIVGVRGRIKAGEKWFFPYYADIGAGSAKLTWQAMAGAGYTLHKTDLMLVYRQLDYEGETDKLIQKFNLGGVALAALFHL
jgi:hypothetical protein